MEKTTSTPANSGSAGLLSRLARKKDSLLDSLVPGWSDSRIESRLFVPGSKDSKTARTPKGFRQFDIKTSDGIVKAYESGKGPTVVFVHGWGGSASQFFPLMRGLAQCGFRSVAFDHLGHGGSEQKPATLHQTIVTTNQVLDKVRQSQDGLCAIVGHSTGCIAIAAARNALVRDLPLFLISPVFNYKLFFLKKLVKVNLHADIVKKYAKGFARSYRSEFQKLELARNLDRYADSTVIAHDESDSESAIEDSIKFCDKHPLTRLLTTKDWDHERIINSESVWQQLKSHLNYDDTSTNITAEVVYR
jgi:pimeloyl-ACP methyl ester carboxylesterase